MPRESTVLKSINIPGEGRCCLIPRSTTTFLVEDAERRLEFELDNSDRAKALTFWKRSGERHLVPRVP